MTAVLLRRSGRGLAYVTLHFIVSLALFHPALEGGILLERDLIRTSHPHKQLAALIWTEGRMPAWNAAGGCGWPLLADISVGGFDPFAMLYALPLGVYTAGTLYIWLKYFLAALAMHRYLRIRGFDAPPSFLGATIFAWSGVSVGSWTLLPYVAALMFTPLLLAIPHAPGSPAGRGLAAGAGLAWIWYSGAVEPLLFTALLWAVETVSTRGGAVREILIGVSSFVCFTLPQTLPAVELYTLSTRAAGFPLSDIFTYSVSPLQAVGIFLPVSFLGVDGAAAPGRIFPSSLPYLMSTYLGISAITLAFLAPWAGQRRWFLAAAAGLLLSFGWYLPGMESFATNFWPRGLRFPVKFLLLVPPALAVLAAAGVERLDRIGEKHRLAALGAALGLTVLVSAVGALHPDPRLHPAEANANFVAVADRLAAAAQRGVIVLLATGLLVMSARPSSIGRTRSLLAALVLFDLLFVGRATLFFEPSRWNEAPVLRREMPETWPRTATIASTYYGDSGSASPLLHGLMEISAGVPFQIRHCGVYTAFNIPRLTAWIDPLIERKPSTAIRRLNGGIADLAAAGVSYFTCDESSRDHLVSMGCEHAARSGPLHLLRVPHVLPEVRFYPGDTPPDRARLVSAPRAAGTFRLFRDGGAHAEFTTPEPGWLFRAESFYPGWKAVLDGVPVPVVPTPDFMGQLIRIERAGMHRAEWSFEPPLFHIGLAAAAAACLASALALLICRPRSSAYPAPSGARTA